MTKKTFLLCVFCVAVALICLARCQSQEKEIPEIAVEKDMVTVTLEENPTTGFTWDYRVEPQDALKFESDVFVPSTDDEKVAGAGGLHTFNFKALKPGMVMLKFEYCRSCEDVEPEETKTYQLTIDDQLNVTLDE